VRAAVPVSAWAGILLRLETQVKWFVRTPWIGDTGLMDRLPERHAALDALRGLTVFLMIPVNAGMGFASIPAWLKHAPAAGLQLADFIMPAFLVALGISGSLSLGKRVSRDGLLRTSLHALYRYGLLFAFGSIGYFLVWKQGSWEVLQMLGATGALAFPFMFLRPLPRIVAALALAATVELLRPAYFATAYQAWHDSGLGGPAGTFALASLPVFASAIGELMRGKPFRIRVWLSATTGSGLLLLGLLASLLSLPDKHLLTPGYLLLTSGSAFLVLALLELPCQRFGDLPLFGAIGRNPLFGYMASGILILVARALVPADSNAAVAWAAVGAVWGIIIIACIIMDRKGWWIKL
jgi:predicted acyltransferase